MNKMTDIKNDELGDKLKSIEMEYAGQRLPVTGYICIRLDGKGFSKFTKGLARPFDKRLSDIMIQTMNHLLESYHLDIGYTQSDEISFYIKQSDLAQTIYSGRIQKLCSILASEATAIFNKLVWKNIPEKEDALAKFDCRVFHVDTIEEVRSIFYWRFKDCRKNAISMAAHHHFGHKKTLNKNSDEKINMMSESGILFSDYPVFFRTGTFAIKKLLEMKIPEELKSYPANAGKETYFRSVTENFSVEKFSEINERFL